MGVLDRDALYIFDIDRTLITTTDSSGELVWLKNMEPPYEMKEEGIVCGGNGTRAVLHAGATEVLQRLQDHRKEIGFLSAGALLDAPYEIQPSVEVMKKLGIYEFFGKHKFLEYKTVDKQQVLRGLGECVFFDDDEKHIVAAMHLDNVVVVDRKSFTSWKQLL